MAKTINYSGSHLGYIDLNKNELRNAVVQVIGTAPSSPSNGQVWYLSSDHRVHVQANGADRYLLTDQDLTTLRDFSQTTGTRASTAISDFTEASQDAVASALTGGSHTGLTVTYGTTQDNANRIDLAVTDSPLLGGQTLAQVRDFSQTTGTRSSSAISNFDTAVRSSRLDQMAVPTASVSLNSQKITSLANGTDPADAVNFSQLEAARQGIRSKPAVDAAMTTNVSLASPGAGPFDGQTLAATERILLMGQSTGSENGIYVWNGAGVAMTRALDADTFAELDSGTETYVQGGTNQGVWRQTAELTAFTGQTWIKVNGGSTYVAGDGLTESPAGTFNVGQGTGISVTADAIAVDTAVIVRKVAGALTGGSLNEVVTHNLNTRDIKVVVRNNSSPWDEVEIESEATSVNTATIRGASNLPAGYRWLVVG